MLGNGTGKIMTAVTPVKAKNAPRGPARLVLAVVAVLAVLGACGCATSHPPPISARELAEAQTFPYFRVYWVGPSFQGHDLSAADGLSGYIDRIGDSVYYGDCVKSKGIFGGGSCLLPLQVTTVVYRLHSNGSLGPQRNMLIRGVPATVYDEGRSIELYTGRVAIDIFSDRYSHALSAARLLLPMNAPGRATGNLPPPVYCPGLSGPQEPALSRAMANLPRHACQQAAAEVAYSQRLSG